MKRYLSWMAMCVTMIGAPVALAQQPMQGFSPYGNPGGFSYPMPPQIPVPPGYPYVYPPQAPLPPMGPYGQPTPPNGPFGYPVPNLQYGNPLPMPVPPDPRLPRGQRGPSLPTYIDGAPKGGPTEPYYVLPEGPQTLPPTRPETPKQGNIVTEPFNRLIEAVASDPSEPYTTYEGPRYMAEVRQDNTRGWVQASFLHWWVRGESTPPLVTTGGPGNPGAGILGQGDTTIVLGNGELAPRELSGVQLTFGMWLDPERMHSLEIVGFWLGRVTRDYTVASDGNTTYAQPIIVGGAEAALLFAQPGTLAGSLTASSTLNFHGLEVNVAHNLLRVNGCSLDWFAGFRYLYLKDALTIDQNVNVLPGGAGLISFSGVPQPAGSSFLINDYFETTNRFYGGTLGARFNWACCRFDLGAGFKLSMGATTHVANINGSTTLVGSGTLPGGTLAQNSNSGRFSGTDFSVVPEFNATVGFQVTCNLRVLVGYSILDWNRIQRAGNQIDRQVDLSQVPTSPGFVPGAVGTAPTFRNDRTDFWAQGINVGIELKY